VHDAFNELPYLRFQGDYGTGKTRALLTIGSVVYRGFFASAASTVSPIFHTLDRFGGTLILDEADLRFSDKTADLVKILNNGSVKGLPVLRTLQNQQKEFNPAAFHVFGPKIVAMRGSFTDEALESRFLTERMGNRPLRSDIAIHLPDSLRSEALALRNKLLHFRLTQLPSIQLDPSRLLPDIDPRLNQSGIALLSLIDDEAVRAEVESHLRGKQARIAVDRQKTATARVHEAMRRIFGDASQQTVPLSVIAEQANADASLPELSVREIGRILRDASVRLYKSNGVIVAARDARFLSSFDAA
jgi:hypothetical protein